MEYWLEGVHGRNRPDAVDHKSCGHGGDGAEVVHIAGIDARYGETVAARGDGGNGDAGVAANPYEAIGRRWVIRQKPSMALVVCVPAVVRTPILLTANVYYDRPNAVMAAIRMLGRNEVEESVAEEDSIEDGVGLLAQHMLGNTGDMGRGIAETRAYPKHWKNVDYACPRPWVAEGHEEGARVQDSM